MAIWLLIGLVLVGGLGFVLVNQVLQVWYRRKNPPVDGLIVGSRLEKARLNGRKLQGTTYSLPKKTIEPNVYYMTIRPRLYKMPLPYVGHLPGVKDENPACANILFWDENAQIRRLLTDRKASIKQFFIPDAQNTAEFSYTPRYCVFLIAFEDTREDDVLDAKDAHDLYVSEMNGGNLRQVTKDNDIVGYDFRNEGRELFIIFRERTDLPELEKQDRFGIYDFETRQYRILHELDKTLLEAERIVGE